jgi:hypothetical protein
MVNSMLGTRHFPRIDGGMCTTARAAETVRR